MIQAVVVEDEVILRKGICTLIDWENLGVEVIADFSNAIDALNFISENSVDLVISDIKMPQMTGLELAKTISEQYSDTKVIILTAYSDFSYPQEALRYRVSDYVLKSNFVKELPESVKAVVETINNENKNKDQNLDDINSKEFIPYIVYSLIHGISIDNNTFNEISGKILFDVENYCMLKVVTNIEKANFTSEDSSANNYIENSLKEIFEDNFFYGFWFSHDVYLIIVKTDSGDIANSSILKFSKEIVLSLKNYFNIDIQIGISGKHFNINEVKSAYENACLAMSSTDESVGLFSSELYNKFSSLEKIKDKFIDVLISDNEDKLLLILSEVTEILSNESSLDYIKINIVNLSNYIFQNLICTNINLFDFYALTDNYESTLRSCDSSIKLFDSFKSIMVKLQSVKPLKTSDCNYLILVSQEYIKTNYDKQIRINDISNILHVNSSYFSRAYKKNTGVSFTNAVNKYRTDKSKELLREKSFLVSEIALMVGFEDAAYFTNVFLKYNDIPPSTYQEMN